MRCFSILLSVLLMLLNVRELRATHAMGVDLQYTCLGNNQYLVRLTFYRDCSGISAPSNPVVNVSAPSCGITGTNFPLTMQTNLPCPNGGVSGTLGCDVSPLCPGQISQNACNFSPPSQAPFPGVRSVVYEGIITLNSPCSQWLVRFTEFARNPSDNIVGGNTQDLSIQATINNTIDPASGQPYCNSSVSFSSLPVPFYCVNNPVTYNQGAVDPNGDSLVYTIVNPLGNNYTPLNFLAGFSISQPIRTNPPNSFQFDPLTGQMVFTPGFVETDVLAVRVDEYKNGVLVGSTMRDIQVKIIPCTVSTPSQSPISNIQNANQQDSITLQVCPGTQVSFDIRVVDPMGRNLTLKSSIQNNPSPLPGATLTQINQGVAPNDTAIARIQWTPAVSDTGCKQFILTAENDDCPIKGNQTRVYKVCIFSKVQLLSSSPTFCGKPVQLTATGGTVFSWNPTTGLSNPNILNPVASPATPTVYRFTSDCGTDSVFVNVAQPFAFDAGPGGQICQNGQIQLNATVDNLYAPYKVKWTPSSGLIDPVFGLPNDSILNPVASPLSTTTYKVQFTANNGCVNEDSVTVNVAGTGPLVQARTGKQIVCPGEPTQLTLISNPQSCGISQQPCLGNDVTAQVGTFTTQSSNSAFQLPSPFGGYSKSARHQMLYRANEILSVISSGGKIKSLSFNLIQPANNVPFTQLNGLTIKMACVSADSLVGYTGGSNLSTVYTPKNYTPVFGWNNIPLDNFYDWDGKSNLLVDICFNTINAGNGPNMKYQMTRTDGTQGFANYRSMWFTESQQFDQCGITGDAPTVNAARYKERPNIRLNICVADLSSANVAWTPNSGANAPNPLNRDTTTARPVTPQIYRVAVTDPNGCTGNSFVFVNVDTTTVLRMNNDTFICAASAAVNVSATVTTAISPAPAYTYTWAASPSAGFVNPGNVSNFNVTPTVTTTYKVTVTGGSCPLYDSVTVSVGSKIPVDMVATNVSCFGANNGSINVNVPGNPPGLNYAWTPNTLSGSVVNALSPGVYSVTVSNQQGCQGADTVIISQPSELQLNISKLNVVCYGQSNGNLTATVIGGTPAYTFNWQPALGNTATPNGLSAGVYALTVVDANGCTISGADSISQPPVFSVSVTTTNANCPTSNDGTATADIVGGVAPYVIRWDNVVGQANRNNLSFGNHTVVVTDANQCTASQTFLIDTNYALRVSIQTTDAACFGQNNGTAIATPLNGTPNYNFQFYNSANAPVNPNALIAGNYTVSVTDGANCRVVEPFVIGQPDEIVLTLSKTDPACSGDASGSASVIASNGVLPYSFLWSNGATTGLNSNLNAGDYSVTVTDGNQCTSIRSITLVNPVQMTLSLIERREISCFGENDASAILETNGGTPPFTYSWSGNPFAPSGSVSSLSNVGPGVYRLTVTDANACFITDSVVFTTPERLGFNFVITDSVSCPGSSDGRIRVLGIGGTQEPVGPPYSYSLDNVLYQQNGIFSNLAASDYRVFVKDANGCLYDTLVNVPQPLPLGVQILPQDSLIELGAQLQLSALPQGYSGNDIKSFRWSPSTGLSCIDCSSPVASPFSDTEYFLTVSYLKGCLIESKVQVFVADGKPFFVPNLISPNNDGVNDVWQVYGYDLRDLDVKIFNRWGEKVFDTGGNQFIGWDGTYKGVLQEPGVYTYFIKAVYLNGRTAEKTGTVTLVR